MGRKRKYEDEYDEVMTVTTEGMLPHKIKTDEPGAFHKALYVMLSRLGIRDFGLSEDNDGVWIRRKDD